MGNRNSANSWITVLVILLLTVGGSLGIAKIIHAVTDSRVGDIKALQMSDVRYAEVVEDKIVAYNGNILNCFTSKGKGQWKSALTIGSGYTVHASREGIVAWKGSSYSVWDLASGNNLSSGSVDGDVISVRAGSRYFAVLYGNNDNCIARVMDTSGRVYDEVQFESQVVLDYGFFSDGVMLWALCADTSGTVPTCTMSTYRPSRKATSGSIREGEQVVYHVQFEKNQICLVGEDYIKHYDYTGAEYADLRTLVYGWFMLAVSEGGENPLMVLAPNTQVSNTVSVSDVRLISNTMDTIVRMPFPCRNLVVKGSRIYGFDSEHVMTAEAGDANVKAYNLPLRIDSVAGVTNDKVGVVYSNGGYYLVTLP